MPAKTPAGKTATKTATKTAATATATTASTKTAKTTLATLLKRKPASSFTSTQLGRKAHVRWRREELFEAFVLFDAASTRAREENDGISVRDSANRAAITLFRSRCYPEEARARLLEVLAYYKNHPKDIEDRHFVDWAATALIEDAADHAQSAAAFRKAYRARVAEVQRLLRSDGFPRIRPNVLRLIEAALRAGADDVVVELVAMRRASKPLPRAVKQRLDEVEAIVARRAR